MQCRCDSLAGNTCGNGQVCQVNWTGILMNVKDKLLG